MEKLPSISKKVRCRAVNPTFSMSVVRKHFWQLVSRFAGGSSSPRKYGLNGCIPAVVRRTDGSYTEGTSDADGMRRCSRSSKKDRKRSRISEAFIARGSLGRGRNESCKPSDSPPLCNFRGFFREASAPSRASPRKCVQFCTTPLSHPGHVDDAALMLLAEQLVGEARERRQRRMESREQLVVGVSAVLFVATACLLAIAIPANRPLSWPLVVGLILGYAVVSRVRFEFASEYVSAEQLAFIPMLLLLPVGLVPLLAAAAALMAILPDVLTGSWDRRRWIMAIGESWFSVGPVLVIALLAPGAPDLNQVHIYALAFVAE